MNDTKAITVRQTGMSVPYGRDALSEVIRTRIREDIVQILAEELDVALGACRHERTPHRRGYRKGSRERTLTTSFGKADVVVPRGKFFDGSEWESTMLPRYARRSREVDAALLGIYFGGVNTRKIKQVLRPMLRNSPLSKSAISRLTARLKEYFEGWRSRSLAEEPIRYLFLDGIYVKVRCGWRTSSLPVMAAVGVRANGEKVLLSLEVRGAEGEAAWSGFLENLTGRGLRPPRLVIVDGSKGLSSALDATWPKGVDRQRCTVHKLRNLLGHAPKHLYDELRADFHAITYADDGAAALVAYNRFLPKWRRLKESVARSLEEAGPELLTFYRYPKSQWKALRTANTVERLNQEFRRRIKTQGAFPTESSVLVLLFGMVASGMIRLRRIVGHEDMGLVAGNVAGGISMPTSKKVVSGGSSRVPVPVGA